MEQWKKAAQILQAGGVIAFPTDTVFGLGALLNRPAAIRRIFHWKKRPRHKPLPVLVSSLRQAQTLGVFDPAALLLAKKGWPGPLTLVVKKTARVPNLVSGGRPTVGLRIPAHHTILKLIRRCGPLVATSANFSGERPAQNMQEVRRCLPQLDFYLSGRVKTGRASKVIDSTQNQRVLRG